MTYYMDIGFSLEHTNSSGDKTLMFPYRRYECDQGNFSTCLVGTYKLVWDNSYSTFFKKVLRYKVDCIPPVVEPLTSGREPLQVADGIVIDILMHGHLVSSSVTDYTMDGGEVQEREFGAS
ncbi:GOLD domain-containing protein [Heracleum sosnowskyi]|uniref:GOLD domain-containing protein n=1 Tax=Heracleum sosnowskyi TaxID=360622 RepID=A0AAD8HT23_9APIA|nr:GOLD domain-containing protein [Heracleum sosnowskyi]KAK1386210.1 GOLD domain-containing protein [Heracleum sosnowskyi]